ncbi:MAG: putative T7SS-secreted protein, partial [Streptomyces sp.]
MGAGEWTPDWLEDGLETGARKVGEGIDASTDFVADRMDDVGVPRGAGKWLRDKGDGAANTFGATVGESQLGETDDHRKLVHGSVATLRANASHLRDFQKAFEKVARGLKGLDSQHLRGKLADAFREKVAVEPKKWHKAADACEKAAKALDDFSDTVSWAQGQAKEALEKYKKAESASNAHKGKVRTYNDAVDYGLKGDDLPDKPGETDPGAAGMREAQGILDDARRQRNDAASTARTAVDAARDLAPEKPSDAVQALSGLQGAMVNSTNVVSGLVKGTAGLLSFARGINPIDPYNVEHPGEYVMRINSLATGTVQMLNNPVETGKVMWEEFKKNPTEFLSRLPPEILGAKGAGMVRKGLGAARKMPDGEAPEP